MGTACLQPPARALAPSHALRARISATASRLAIAAFQPAHLPLPLPADIMALRCKGRGCEILNYSLGSYSELLPLLECLPQVSWPPLRDPTSLSRRQVASRLGRRAWRLEPGTRVPPPL